jgi:glutamate racemase
MKKSTMINKTSLLPFRIFLRVLFAILLLNPGCRRGPQSNEDLLKELYRNKKDVTIVVTDSGLGGLSIVADFASRLPISGVFRSARIVFFSALFKEKSGYNSLTDESDKARIFQIVLEAMEDRYSPDLLLIGCNTLSVVYPETPFSRQPAFPVVGIIETGADLIAGESERTPEATAVIFATRTTVESEVHKKILVARGMAPEKIVGQACHKLAGAINRGAASEETKGLIDGFVAEALAKVPEPGAPLFASLNCTDYGYSADLFRQAFAAAGYPDIPIIDPNSRLADFLFAPPLLHRFPGTQVAVEVVSKTIITDEMIHSIGSLLQTVSPSTAEALRIYRHDPQLFDPQLNGVEFID